MGRGYEFNRDFFKTLTKDSAWIYGWLVTDGCVREKSWQVILGLHTKDRDVLEKIQRKLSYTGKIYDREREDGRVSSTLRICSRELCEDLYKLGIARTDKTFNTTFPKDINKEVYWDFIRGTFEGDGSLSHRTGNTDALQLSICGATKQFVTDLHDTLLEYGINTRMTEIKSGLWNIESKSNADALRMCYFMFAQTTADNRLNRKFQTYENYVQTYYDTVRRRSAPCIEMVELARQTIFNAELTHN